jgi:thiol-disulfide isomerase/thioredoxin
MRKWAALALAGCFWAGTGAADEALDAWRAAYPAKLDALQTVREKAEFRMEMAIGGMKSVQVMESEFLFRRPDALVAKGPFAELYVLGTNATTYQKMMQNEYRRETADEGLAAYLEDFRGEMLMLQADKKLLLQADADGREEILDELLGEAGARRLPDEELEGRTCEVLVARMDSMFKTSWVKIWVDAETGLLRRIESVPAPEGAPAEETEEDEPEVARALRDVKIVYAVLEQRVNEPIPDEAFAFVPPEGATEDVVTPEEEQAEEIAETDREIQKAAGLDRFALSGQAAPDFELPLLAGGTFKLSEQKGKVVVIDFWATWCGPCVRALPEMKKLAEAYAENPEVVVVGFSTDEEKNRDQVEKLVAKNKLAYPIGLGPAEAKTAFKVSGIPCIVVVGQDGVVQGRRVGFSPKLEKDLKRAVDALLAGETLESAAPYTAEELKVLEDGVCPKCGKRHGACSSRSRETKLDEKAFKLRWSRAVQSGDAPRSARMGMERVVTAIPPRTFLRLDGAKAVVVDAASGEIARTVDLPADLCATNEQGEVPEMVLVRSPEGDVLVGYQEFYTVTKKDTSTSYRGRKSELFGMRLPDGEPWRKKLDDNESLRGLFVVPLSATEDLLVAATWSELRFLDATGATTLKQNLDYQAQAMFALDAAGKPVLYLAGKKIELYDLVWPPETPAAEPVAPAAEEPPAAE